SNLGFGMRSWRYSAFINDKKVEQMFVEPEFSDNCATDPFEVSDVNTMVEYLKSK
ncbi:MAG: peroxiredoxin, partial [Myxococcota bacterium]